MTDRQILTVSQMQLSEQRLIDGGTSVDALMLRAGIGAAEYIWRIAAGGAVTVLCGPGNNGGDGYVIAENLRHRGLNVTVIAPLPPVSEAATNARAAYQGGYAQKANFSGRVFVDCLFGSGLKRPLGGELQTMLRELAEHHALRVAIDLPSGIESDSGRALNENLPDYHLTIALGAWKYAHFLNSGRPRMGQKRLVPLGVFGLPGAAQMLAKPKFCAPSADAHKYRRGMLLVIGGAMSGAAILASKAAQFSGAGYIKLAGSTDNGLPPDLVTSDVPLADMLADPRNQALLIGPGLGRGASAQSALVAALRTDIPLLLDADALRMVTNKELSDRTAPTVLTPHEGELRVLEQGFGIDGGQGKAVRALSLAKVSGAVVVAKGPDTAIAEPGGSLVLAPRASSWLSVAGTGDVLAGLIASRMASGRAPFAAACEGVWLHSEAARRCDVPFSASQLAQAIPAAYAACL